MFLKQKVFPHYETKLFMMVPLYRVLAFDFTDKARIKTNSYI